MKSSVFTILDIETVILGKRLPLDRIQESIASSGNPYFDNVTRNAGAIVMRKEMDMALVAEDGTIRTIVQNRSIKEAKDLYLRVIEILQKVLEFDWEKLEVALEINAILHQEGTKDARDALRRFVGQDKVKQAANVIGEDLAGLGLTILARNFIKDDSRERLEYEVQPLATDPRKYYIRVRYEHRPCTGISFLQKIDDFSEKSSDLVKFVEAG